MGDVLNHRGDGGFDTVALDEPLVRLRVRLGKQPGRPNVEHVLEMVAHTESGHDEAGIGRRGAGKHELAAVQTAQSLIQRRARRYRLDVDIVHVAEKRIGVGVEALHHAAQSAAVAGDEVAPHRAGLVRADAERALDKCADAPVDLPKQVVMGWIERVVEVEDPHLDMIEIAAPSRRLRCARCHGVTVARAVRPRKAKALARGVELVW